MTGKTRDNYNANYLNYVKTQDPPTQHFKNCASAFGVGGLICCIGQFIRYMFEFAGLSGDELAGATSMVLIFLGCFLTGLGVYDRIGRYAGAGSIVPITGFANGGVDLRYGCQNVHRCRGYNSIRRVLGRTRRIDIFIPVIF